MTTKITQRKFLGSDPSRTAKKTVRRTILLTERKFEMTEEIAQEKGISTFTSVIENAIDFYYKQTFPAYVNRAGAGTMAEKTHLTPEQVAINRTEAKALEKKAEQDRKDGAKALICRNDLRGRVEDDGNGYKYCIFPTHTPEHSSEMKIPLVQSSPVIARTSLFMPSKAAVLKARPELAGEYGNE